MAEKQCRTCARVLPIERFGADCMDVCSRCHRHLPPSAYSPAARLGKFGWCNECRNSSVRDKNRTKRIATQTAGARGGRKYVCMLEKTCGICNSVKVLSDFCKKPSAFDGREGICKVCDRPRKNANCRQGRASGGYKRDPERLRAAQKRLTAKRKAAKCWLEPSEREKRIAYKRARRVAMGAKPRPPDWGTGGIGPSLWEQNARQAWKHWMCERASDEWVVAYYSAKPWRNPRLSSAQQFKLRYELDAEFNAQQRDKALRINPQRKAKIERLSDGTITPGFLRSLFAAAKQCPYCGTDMGSYDKSLDHIEPLDPGLHAASNVCVCCKTCNVRKRRMPLDVFLQRHGYRRAA